MFINKISSGRKYKSDITSERPLRSILKAISWRIIGTLDTVIISWFLTREIKTALAIGSIELVTKMLLYFGHERLWNRINFGKEKLSNEHNGGSL